MSRARRALALQSKIDSLDQHVQALFTANDALRKQIVALERRLQSAAATEHPSVTAGEAMDAAPAPSAVAPAPQTPPQVAPSIVEPHSDAPPATAPIATPPSAIAASAT